LAAGLSLRNPRIQREEKGKEREREREREKRKD